MGKETKEKELTAEEYKKSCPYALKISQKRWQQLGDLVGPIVRRLEDNGLTSDLVLSIQKLNATEVEKLALMFKVGQWIEHHNSMSSILQGIFGGKSGL